MEQKSLSRACLNSIPKPDSSWDLIMSFCDRFSQEIDGYGYGDLNGGFEAFLRSSEELFNNDGTLPDNIHVLLVLIYLVYRRARWMYEYQPEQNDKHLPFARASLQKAHTKIVQ